MVKQFCDMCEKEICDKAVIITLDAKGMIQKQTGKMDHIYDYEFELCPACAAKVAKPLFNGDVIPTYR